MPVGSSFPSCLYVIQSCQGAAVYQIDFIPKIKRLSPRVRTDIVIPPSELKKDATLEEKTKALPPARASRRIRVGIL